MAERIQLRRGTAAAATSANPVLTSGEIGVETDTGRAKIGNGSTAWTSLPYIDAAIADHPADPTNAHAASAIGFSPTGSIAATDVQAAVAEVASEAASALSAHTGNGTGAHAASAISYAGSTNLSATTVEAALDELDAEKAAVQTTRTYPAPYFHPNASSVEDLSYAGVPAWLLDAAGTESVGGRIPAGDLAGWATANVTLKWFAITTDTGNVVVTVRYRSLTSGVDVGAGYSVTSLGNVTTAAVGSVGFEMSVSLGTLAITAGQDLAVRVWRLGTDAADTFPTNMWFSCLELTKAS